MRFVKLYVMPKQSKAIAQLPPQTQNALIELGSHLAVARLRRRESLRTWADRIGITVPTLRRIEVGDPGVSIGAVATALWLMGRDGELARIAEPATDQGALELDVRAAQKLAIQRSTNAKTIVAKRGENLRK